MENDIIFGIVGDGKIEGGIKYAPSKNVGP
jgi:hypothetical protein